MSEPSSTLEGTKSIADMIPDWFEGGTTEQMLDEALAQIRTLEKRLEAAKALMPFADAAFVATPGLSSGERFEAVRAARKALFP